MIKLTMRNIRRNLRRSILTSLSLFVSAFVVVALHSYLTGFMKATKEMTLKLETGYITIGAKEFFKRKIFLPPDAFIKNPDEIIDRLRRMKEVDKIVKRIEFSGSVIKGEKRYPFFTIGIEKEKEKELFNVEKKIIEGRYDIDNGVVIGKLMAEKLKVKIGDTLLLITKNTKNAFVKKRILITGIADFGLTKFNNNVIITSLKNAEEILNMDRGVSLILVFLKKEKYMKRVIENIKLPPGVEAKSYREQLGVMAFYYDLADKIYFIMYILIVILAAFAIVNTMTVAVFERMREIGTLKSMGMTDGEIFRLFGLEGTILGTVGGFFGAGMGWLTAYLLSFKGINFEPIAKDVSFPMPYIIKPSTSFSVFLMAFLLTVMVSFIASIVPALYAKRLSPAEALTEI